MENKNKLAKKNSDCHENDAFTLLELLIVLAIIGVLAATVMIAVGSARVKSRDAKRAGDMKQMMSALEQYHIANGIYPTGTASVRSVGTGAAISDPAALDSSVEPFVPNYVPLLPEAPKPDDNSSCPASGRGSNAYWYDVEDDGSYYTMTFCLGKDTGTWSSGMRQLTPDGIQ